MMADGIWSYEWHEMMTVKALFTTLLSLSVQEIVFWGLLSKWSQLQFNEQTESELKVLM